MIIESILLAFLIIFSIIDWKVKAIPSIFLTGLIFVFAVVNIENMSFGIIAFVFAWLLREANFIGGTADIKVITIIGFIIASQQQMMTFVILMMLSGIVYKAAMKYILKEEEEVAFIPAIMIAYFAYLLSQGMYWNV